MERYGRRRLRLLVAWFALAALGASLLVVGVPLRFRGLQDAANVAQLVGIVLAVAGLGAQVWLWSVRSTGGGTNRAAVHVGQVYLTSKTTVNMPQADGSTTIEVVAGSVGGDSRPKAKFDLANTGGREVRVEGIRIRTMRHVSVDIADVAIPTSAEFYRAWTCHIGPEKGLYECKHDGSSFDYLKLAPGELERILIVITAESRGLYTLAVVVSFTDGRSANITEGGQAFDLLFF